WGTNTAQFSYPVTGQSGNAAQVMVSSYSSGDAKWYFRNVSVSAGAIYAFSDAYKSTVQTYLTAAYTLSNGAVMYEDLALLPPSSNWAVGNATIKIPSGAVSMTVFHLIKQNGTLAVDNFSLKSTSGGGGGGDLSKFSEGMVSINFDDGYKSTYLNTFGVLQSAGYRATDYIITGNFGFTDYMTKDDVLTMYNAGDEIGAHTRTHADLASIPLSQAQDEIAGSKADLAAMGISATTFAYPFGSYNDSVVNIVRNAGFVGARSTNGGVNVRGGTNFYTLNRHGVVNTTTLSQVQGWVDDALANKTWAILVFHRVDSSNTLYSTTPAMFQSIVNYLKQKNVKVITNREGITLMKQ
ncbi:polysaccharide deacetylase family protein, partial [Candidatus Parcubacteria bacterium]|nr:polysaccharide deacetylase family protein [Candidatus Parcubacteria bacterium]